MINKKFILREKLRSYDGQGGWISDWKDNVGRGVKTGLGIIGQGANQVAQPFRNLVSNVKDLTSPDPLLQADSQAGLQGKWLGSGKGERIRQRILDRTYFSPEVKGDELKNTKIRQSNLPNAPFGGIYRVKNVGGGGKQKSSLVDNLFGKESQSVIINSSVPSEQVNSGSHEILHKVFDQNISNQPVENAFLPRFLDVVSKDERAVETLKELGLLGNPLYGSPGTVEDSDPTEVFAYIGQVFASRPWDMPPTLRPFYKGVLDFNVPPAEQEASYNRSARESMTSIQNELRTMQEAPIRHPRLSKESLESLSLGKRELQSLLNELSQANYDYVMARPTVLAPEKKRSVIQKVLRGVTQPVRDFSKGVGGYLKNF